MVWKGGFERTERHFAASVIRPGMRVVNVGANAGLYAVIASRLVGAEGEVYAYEPGEESFARLLRNLALNDVRNVRALRLAIASGPGRLALWADPENPDLDGHLRCRPFDGPPPPGCKAVVECDSLDRQLAAAGGTVDVMIIDVEGGECDVLAGALGVIRQSPELLIMVECTARLEETATMLRQAGMALGFWSEGRERIVPSVARRGTMYACRPGNRWLMGRAAPPGQAGAEGQGVIEEALP